jgi:hypothetical protein
MELVTTGKWTMSAFTIVPGIDWNDDGIIETDIYSVMDSCMKDDFTIFKSNGIATGDEGPTKCDSSDTQTYDQPWSFTSNETKMNFDGDIYNIDVLTEQQLKISIENHVVTGASLLCYPGIVAGCKPGFPAGNNDWLFADEVIVK